MARFGTHHRHRLTAVLTLGCLAVWTTASAQPDAREIVEEHLNLCLAAGINHEGINAEVAKGQWEFQIFGKGSKKAADEMWIAR